MNIHAVHQLIEGLEGVLAGLRGVVAGVVETEESPMPEYDLKDLKQTVGGLQKLTDLGVEVCYRLFDQGLTRYAVCQKLQISFGAANHRYESWRALGGPARPKKALF